jgi:hypothetical protein
MSQEPRLLAGVLITPKGNAEKGAGKVQNTAGGAKSAAARIECRLYCGTDARLRPGSSLPTPSGPAPKPRSSADFYCQ